MSEVKARSDQSAATYDASVGRDGESRAASSVAVIAVHGVGHHEPSASARAMTEMLLRTPRKKSAQFTSFREVGIQVPTRPVQATPQLVKRDSHPAPMGSWSERSAHPRLEQNKNVDPDYLLMSEQLAGYKPEDADGVYDTVRFEGRHLASAPPASDARTPNVDADVHVYEFFWSDLSRIGPSVFSLFGAFYQLVIHLPYIGRSTIEFARAADKGNRRTIWATLSVAHTWAMRALTLFIPTLNMVMLATGLALLVRHVPANYERAAAIAVLALAAVIAVAAAMYRSSATWRGVFIALPLIAGTLVVVLTFRISEPRTVLLYEAWLATAFALVAVLSVFQKNRPGAMPVGLLLLAASLALLGWYTRGARHSLTAIVLPVLEWQYLALSISWIAFGAGLLVVILASGALAVALLADRSSAKDSSRSMLNRATYTARFALAVPAVAFSVATLLVWGLIVTAESKTAFDSESTYQPVFHYPALIAHVARDATTGAVAAGDTTRGCAVGGDVVRCAPAYFIRTFAGAMDTRYGFVSTAGSLLALLIVVIVLGPVLWTEIKSPRSPPSPTDAKAFDARSGRLGVWLNFAFGSARVAGELLAAVCLVAFVGLVMAFPTPPGLTIGFSRPTLGLETGIGFVTYGSLLLGGASALSIVAVFRLLSGAGAGLRPALGIAADVDNYLRELPRDRTPRARMAERYTSLLRYICEWRADARDPKSGYDAVIIVAHSQGTVISADLLRYLRQSSEANPQWEPRLARLRGAVKRLPIHLFTMGSPLRQLYAQRFPHLYAWTCAKGPEIGPQESTLLGVDRWLNAYRTADYVGRGLWGEPLTKSSEYTPVNFAAPPTHGDECIGPGAHTHYWDDTADSVAKNLGELIDAAVHVARRA